MKNILIITGGNKGLGLGIAEVYQKNNYQVFSINRSIVKTTFPIEQFSCDLSNSASIEPVLKSVFSEFSSEKIQNLTLINNAGDLGTINTVENLNAEQISYPIQVNLIAPLILSSLFIKLSKDLNCTKKIINISSGAATNPYESWVTYCASKAGLDMMTKVIAKEQLEHKNGVHSVAIYPGIIDTQMQVKLRNTPTENFNNIQRFVDFYKNKQLVNPLQAAEKLFHLDSSGKLINGSVLDLRNF